MIKSAVAFFFLFFLHGTSIGNGQQGISYNAQILPMVGISRYYCSTTAQKLNSSTNAQLWHVCPTIGNILLAAVTV